MHKHLPPLLICHYKPNKNRYLYLESKLHDYSGDSLYIKIQDASGLKSFQAHVKKINSHQAYLSRAKIAKRQLYVHLAHQYALLHNNGVILPSFYTHAKATISSFPQTAYDYAIAPHQPRNISPSVLSLALKHRYACSLMLRYSIPWAIVAEDDIVFRDTSIESIKKLHNHLSKIHLQSNAPVFVDLAGGCNLKPHHPDSVQSSSAFGLRRLELPVTRTTCAYMINLKFAFHFLSAYAVPCTAIDCELTDYMIQSLSSFSPVQCYWQEPTVFLHGSEVGQYESTIFH